ncbi:MAG: hypothetical protein IJ997_00465, partial [Mycoplasmataceae bacterium]|nr:hypothetical protein [Mycoplasmataceae bacterium]
STIKDTNYTLDLNHALGNVENSNNRTISVGTSNIVKSIPQGYIVVSGNSNNNKNQQVVCLDKNDPTQELWQLDLGGNNNSNENINIYGVEYTPYDGGRLVVLYSEDASDNTYKSTANSSQIKFKVFNNLNSNQPQLDFAGFGSEYRNEHGDDTGGRLDTWGISPIFNLNGEVTKYLIYCKEQYFTNNDNNGRTRFYLVDLKNHTNSNKCQDIKIRWEKANYSNDGTYQGHRKIILSIASVEIENQVYMIPLIIDFVDNKLELGIYKLTNNGSFEFVHLENIEHIKFEGINVDENIFNNKDSSNTLLAKTNKAADLVKGSISSSTFKIENNKLKIAFAINMSPNGTRTSPHRGGKLITLEIGNNFNIISQQIKQLFQNNQSNDNLGSKEELWHGYFANEVIAKHGINVTKTNNSLTPFISIGWNQQKLQPEKYPWIVSIIKNPFDSAANYNFNETNVEDKNNFRVYRVNGNTIDTSKGIYSGNGNHNGDQFGYQQFGVGIPILDYNDGTENNNVFERNILFTWNKKQEAIIINQKD